MRVMIRAEIICSSESNPDMAYTIEAAAALGFGTREYELITVA